jgi:hypothetical protein
VAVWAVDWNGSRPRKNRLKESVVICWVEGYVVLGYRVSKNPISIAFVCVRVCYLCVCYRFLTRMILYAKHPVELVMWDNLNEALSCNSLLLDHDWLAQLPRTYQLYMNDIEIVQLDFFRSAGF